MKGSILFNKDINIEVDVDPAADEGAKLTSAVNLVDGQELGIGGSDLPEVTAADAGKVLAVNASGEWAANNPFDVVLKVNVVEGNWNDIETIAFDEASFFYKIEHNKPINIYVESVTEENHHKTWFTRLTWTEGVPDWTLVAMDPYYNNGVWIWETHDIILVYENEHYIWVLD